MTQEDAGFYRFYRKEKNSTVAIYPTYSGVHFQLLMDLLVQVGFILITLTQWIAGVLLERTVVM